ncbi:hypothetical protein [Rhizobium leguminosarum]|uniref:hypothetical protein n=1 Tax=Rhizobium leguminosarum TaxID=384 RepID=UPI003F9965EF
MPKTVINVLEMIDVANDNSAFTSRVQCLLGHLVKATSVQEPRQRIGLGTGRMSFYRSGHHRTHAAPMKIIPDTNASNFGSIGNVEIAKPAPACPNAALQCHVSTIPARQSRKNVTVITPSNDGGTK